MPLATMLAAAFAIAEAFEFVSTGNGLAGRVPVGLSLWQPGANWLEGDGAPILEYLLTRLWLIGQGPLGQANLWVLGPLPFCQQDLGHNAAAAEAVLGLGRLLGERAVAEVWKILRLVEERVGPLEHWQKAESELNAFELSQSEVYLILSSA